MLAIGPGFTDTPGMQHNMAGLDVIAGGNAQQVYAKMSLAGRLGQPDDIAYVIVFAVSDLSMYMTGSTILVDGGEVAAGGAG